VARSGGKPWCRPGTLEPSLVTHLHLHRNPDKPGLRRKSGLSDLRTICVATRASSGCDAGRACPTCALYASQPGQARVAMQVGPALYYIGSVRNCSDPLLPRGHASANFTLRSYRPVIWELVPGDAAMGELERRSGAGRRSENDRRSGVDTRSEDERRAVGERRSNKDRRSGSDRRSSPQPHSAHAHKH
jgi:hypothetical protein